MHMLYNSDSFAVVLFEATPDAKADDSADAGSADGRRGGYEIVDKFAGKEIFISGPLAASFRAGVDQLIASSPSEEEMDDYIQRYSALMQQPLVLH